MKILYCIFVFFIIKSLNAQTTFTWKKVDSIEIKNELRWDVDYLANIYFLENDLLKKINATPRKEFHQSIKKTGNISSIDLRNPMKIMLFSEDQQAVFFMDNTLSLYQESIDLSNYDIQFATHFSGSNQSDKVWVFDQQNSTLHRLALNKSQSFKIENFSSIVRLKRISFFNEINDVLFVGDGEKVVLLDFFGNQKDEIQFTFDRLHILKNYIIFEKDKQLVAFNLNTKEQVIIELPIKSFKSVKFTQDFVYFQHENKIYTFKIDFINK